jgi:hypothetical protein
MLEDANSIQVALMQGMRLLLTNQIDHKTAALLFYGLQTASTNLRRVRFEPIPEEVVIDPRGIRDTSLGDKAWYTAEFEKEEEADEEDSSDDAETVDIKAMADPECASDIELVEIHGRLGRSTAQRCQLQMGVPLPSRRTRVSVPLATSRARIRSASPCLTLTPVMTTASPLAKLTPMSSRNGCGQR